MTRRVVLVNPYDLGRQPFALAEPAALLERAGFSVSCLDLSLLEADPDSLEFEVRTSLKDISVNLGLAHETFYRELARLENDKIITRDEKRIKILRPPGP